MRVRDGNASAERQKSTEALAAEWILIVRGSDAEVADSLRPVALIVGLGDDDLGCAGERGRGRGARAAVVDGGCDLPEQPLLVDFADDQAAGLTAGQGQPGAVAPDIECRNQVGEGLVIPQVDQHQQRLTADAIIFLRP